MDRQDDLLPDFDSILTDLRNIVGQSAMTSTDKIALLEEYIRKIERNGNGPTEFD